MSKFIKSLFKGYTPIGVIVIIFFGSAMLYGMITGIIQSIQAPPCNNYTQRQYIDMNVPVSCYQRYQEGKL